MWALKSLMRRSAVVAIGLGSIYLIKFAEPYWAGWLGLAPNGERSTQIGIVLWFAAFMAGYLLVYRRRSRPFRAPK
jgi:hypothetical protein